MNNKIKELKEQAVYMGVDINIELFNGEGYHYYDTITSTIMLDNTSDNITIEDIIHEYTHHLQWVGGYRGLVARELEKDFNLRSFEYHAELTCTNYDKFLVEGKLNKKEILSYYEDIIAYFYEEE